MSNRQQRRAAERASAKAAISSDGTKAQIRLSAAVAQHQLTGKFAAVIFNEATGEPLQPPEFVFDTMEAAKEAGSAILTLMIEKMRAQGMTAYRPGS